MYHSSAQHIPKKNDKDYRISETVSFLTSPPGDIRGQNEHRNILFGPCNGFDTHDLFFRSLELLLRMNLEV